MLVVLSNKGNWDIEHLGIVGLIPDEGDHFREFVERHSKWEPARIAIRNNPTLIKATLDSLYLDVIADGVPVLAAVERPYDPDGGKPVLIYVAVRIVER